MTGSPEQSAEPCLAQKNGPHLQEGGGKGAAEVSQKPKTACSQSKAKFFIYAH